MVKKVRRLDRQKLRYEIKFNKYCSVLWKYCHSCVTAMAATGTCQWHFGPHSGKFNLNKH